MVLGCGDVGLRFSRMYAGRLRIVGIVRRDEARDAVRAAGALPLRADLDARRGLRRLAGLAPRVLHSAPPPTEGRDDPRTRHALVAMHRAQAWVYLSTTGVYGDCAGARFDETRAVAPRNDRAVRRVAAERALRRRAARGAVRATVLRVPGIYAAERLPLERLQRGTPALVDADDVHTNHIHADDLARIAFVALMRGHSQRTVHAVDDSSMRMGEYFDAVARAYGLPPPPRLPRDALRAAVSPMLWSFMSESRRLDNRRLRRELRVRLRWPTVDAFLQAHGGSTAS
ncbi:MAG: NAD-dependent epimerase/dehydratase family protein [Burkholderiaceae bacterium]|nr:NAD-dependent epimerase/dehydratase family protein [Burkholderiales bacterium]MCZ8336754.1 NAD-dependent epimerase/dehydratase family protein [Burkholderiaceae bacterium]